ncbi:MAG TPA: hypothetical protein VLC47_13915 [Burkholderiales bacterium]|nr:hypothetical protein [Burkholderiales bacterium]
MAALIIADLPAGRALDQAAMASVRGGLSWVNGAFALPLTPSAVSAYNFLQINNIQNNIQNNLYVAEMVNHNQIVDIKNQGASSNITAVVISSLNNGGLDFKV